MMQQLIPDKNRTARLLDALQSVSKQTGKSKAQIALAWLRYRPVPVIPIIGARKISQLQDNIASLEVSLTPEQVAVLDEASKIDLGFPHEFYAAKWFGRLSTEDSGIGFSHEAAAPKVQKHYSLGWSEAQHQESLMIDPALKERQLFCVRPPSSPTALELFQTLPEDI